MPLLEIPRDTNTEFAGIVIILLYCLLYSDGNCLVWIMTSVGNQIFTMTKYLLIQQFYFLHTFLIDTILDAKLATLFVIKQLKSAKDEEKNIFIKSTVYYMYKRRLRLNWVNSVRRTAITTNCGCFYVIHTPPPPAY